MKKNEKAKKRIRRKKHIRKTVNGTMEKPRVYIYRSNKYIYVGVTDDESGNVLAHVKGDKNVKSAAKIGGDLGKKLKKKKIEQVVFDRSGYKYHGRVEAVANGLREAGIEV